MNTELSQLPDQMHWRKSTYSQAENDCVEIAVGVDGGRWLRDSKNSNQNPHHFTAVEWTAFIKGIQAGEFD